MLSIICRCLHCAKLKTFKKLTKHFPHFQFAWENFRIEDKFIMHCTQLHCGIAMNITCCTPPPPPCCCASPHTQDFCDAPLKRPLAAGT